MAKFLKYMGEFLSRAGVVWRAEIYVESVVPFVNPGSLTFEADEALTIEWGNKAKYEAICGSSATLRIESPGDRTYFDDLYRVEPGSVRLDVRRNGALYWRGTLDTEFYEEPYERASRYPVSLTFSDFGILDRLKYDMAGLHTIREIVGQALERAGLMDCDGMDNLSFNADDLCSTLFADEDAEPATIDRIAVRSDNFFDEEGEASDLSEVIDGMLFPLGLRLVQRAGCLWLYDLNGLYKRGALRAIAWSGDSSTLSVDSVYNNVTITFSPYTAQALIGSEVEFTGEYSVDKYNASVYWDFETYNTGYFSYACCYSLDDRPTGRYGDWRNINFTIFLSPDRGRGVAAIAPEARYAHILPVSGGGPQETDCVAWCVVAGHDTIDNKLGATPQILNDVSPLFPRTKAVMTTQRAFLPYLPADERNYNYLRLTLEMLLDVRYNPFSGETDSNEEANFKELKKYGSWVFVPIAIHLYTPEGDVYHYENRARTILGTQGTFNYAIKGGEWVKGATTRRDLCFLAYYDPEDPKGSTAMGQWSENRQNIGRPDYSSRITAGSPEAGDGRNVGFFPDKDSKFRIYESFKNMPSGEFIPYPPKGGEIEITVFSAIRGYQWGEPFQFDDGHDLPEGSKAAAIWQREGLYRKIRWLLYKAPKLEIVKNNLIFDTAELDDVVYSGELNVNAKEELTFNTICGTPEVTSPTARGVYSRTSDGSQIMQLTRAGVTDCPERLLMGTIYSQYSQRHVKISGEVTLDSGGLAVYSEPSQPPERKFIAVGETQNVIEDTAEAVFVELSPETYKAKFK